MFICVITQICAFTASRKHCCVASFPGLILYMLVRFLVQELQNIEPDFVLGLGIPRPTMKERDQLGSGGNGQVFKFPIGGQELAVKWVRRQT